MRCSAYLLAALCLIAGGGAVWAFEFLAVGHPAGLSGEDVKSQTVLKRNDKVSDLWAGGNGSFNLACGERDRFCMKGNHLHLLSGTFLIEAAKPTTVYTPTAQVELKAGALAAISIEPGAERVFCILEKLALHSHHQSVGMRFGEEAYLCDHQPHPEELIGFEQIGVRRMHIHHVGRGHTIATMEFSLIQLAERYSLLNKVIHSRHPHDRDIKERVLKAAAVLNFVTARHGHYTSHYR